MTLESRITAAVTAIAQDIKNIRSNFKTLNAKLVSRPNLCPDVDTWDLGVMYLSVDHLGLAILANNQKDTYTAESPFIIVQQNNTYVLTADTQRIVSNGSGEVYVGLVGYNGSKSQVWDSNHITRGDYHTFNDNNLNRDKNAIELKIPSGVVYVKVRFVCQNMTGSSSISVGIRQVKLERGTLPATNYSNEASVNLNTEKIKTLEARIAALEKSSKPS